MGPQDELAVPAASLLLAPMLPGATRQGLLATRRSSPGRCARSLRLPSKTGKSRDRYQVTTDTDSGIRNDPNAWAGEHGDPRYIVDLVKRVVRVRVETVDIVRGLPAHAEATQSEELAPE